MRSKLPRRFRRFGSHRETAVGQSGVAVYDRRNPVRNEVKSAGHNPLASDPIRLNQAQSRLWGWRALSAAGSHAASHRVLQQFEITDQNKKGKKESQDEEDHSA